MNLYLWQRPKASFKHLACEDDPIWYENAAVGHNSLGEMMTNISKLARLSKIYTNNCIRGAYVAVLDSLLEDFPVISSPVPVPAPVGPRFQHILPRTSSDERPTMVSVTGNFVHHPEQTVSSRCLGVHVSPSPCTSGQSQTAPSITQMPVTYTYCESHPVTTASGNSAKISTFKGIDSLLKEKQLTGDFSRSTQPLPGSQCSAGQREQQSSHDANRPSLVHRSNFGSPHNQLQPPSMFPESTQSGLPSQVLAGNYSSSMLRSRVVHSQTAPLVATTVSSFVVRGSSGSCKHHETKKVLYCSLLSQ